MDDYTPTTDDIRSAFVDYSESADFPTQKHYLDWKATGGAEGEFDRWLAEHDRVVAANAWDEGAKAGAEFGYLQGRANGLDHPPIASNPYRITEENN